MPKKAKTPPKVEDPLVAFKEHVPWVQFGGQAYRVDFIGQPASQQPVYPGALINIWLRPADFAVAKKARKK